MKAFVSWSGGKDGLLAFYKAKQDREVEIVYLLNMISEDGTHSRTHGISAALLRAQADALGLPIIQKKTAWGDYEEEFKKTVSVLKKEGIQAGVFGDIDLQEHRDWVERVCSETGIKPFFPLWQMEREDIMRELIASGFEATVVASKRDELGPEWLGRKIDEAFIKDLKGLGGIDLCGEAGEYHSFVSGGPLFNKKIELSKTRKVKKDIGWFLDVMDYEICAK
ncbi:MAG: diphthine--ammonia ligase [Candidatus Omnitrophota bacterium]|nr:MAG: diphthine--ammonia ligase [Candidatus Omnitrophota bacterium]